MAFPLSAKRLAALALLGFSSVVDAVGQAIVVNQCNFPAYSETYQINPDGGGISLKIGTTDSVGGSIIQLEYTYLDTLWYDLSRINGSPFGQHDLTLIPSLSSCEGVYCRPNGYCGAGNVFYQPYDNSAIKACDPSTNLVFTLCSSRGNGKGKQSGGAPASASEPNTSSVPSSSPTSAPGTGFHSVSVPHITLSSAAATSTYFSPDPALAPSPSASSAAISAPAAGQPLTTFITEYVTVQATVDKIVTVTARDVNRPVYPTSI